MKNLKTLKYSIFFKKTDLSIIGHSTLVRQCPMKSLLLIYLSDHLSVCHPSFSFLKIGSFVFVMLT